MADFTAAMEVEADPNLVVVNLEHCVSSEGAHLGKSSCIYTTTMPSSSCHDMLQLTAPVQCLGDINQSLSRLHQHSAQLLPLQYPQVQVSYENASTASLQQGSSIMPPSSIYQSSTLHYSQAAPFLTPLPPPVTFLEAPPQQELQEQEIIPLEHQPPAVTIEECKYPVNDFDYYKEIENYLCTAEYPLGASETYIKNLKTRSKHYLITEGVLHHNPKLPKRVVTTKEEQLKLLESAHLVKKTGIHQGIKKMVAVLQEKYFWRGMYDAVANFVKKCNQCRDTVQPNCVDAQESEKGTLSVRTQTNSVIWNEVEVIVHGPFEITSGRNEFIVTMADPSSCFVVGTSISQHGHCTKVAQFILRTFYTLGFPYSRVTVPTNLIDAIRTEFNWCLKGKNAMRLVEQTEDTKLPWVAQLVSILVKRFPSKWDKELDRFLYQFRTGGIKQLGAKFLATPFYAMFNRKHCQDAQENKENSKESTEKLKMICRKCNESFISKVSYRFHMKHHRKKPVFVDSSSIPPASSSGAGGAKVVSSCDKGSFNAPEDCVEVTVNAVKAVLDETKSERKKRGKYQKYSTELQLDMASYANKHGSSRAAEHFSKIVGATVSESTIRNILKFHSQFTPALKEEIGKFAVDFGIDRAASNFSERLNKVISVRMVRRFKNFYLNKVGGDSKSSCADSKVADQSDLTLQDLEENSSTLHSINISSSFAPQLSCQTSACFAQPTSIAPLTQNSSGYTMQVVHSTYAPHPSQQIHQDDNEGVVAQHFLLVTPDGGHGSFEMSIQADKEDDKGCQTWVSEFQSFQVDPQVFIETCAVEQDIPTTDVVLPAELPVPPEPLSTSSPQPIAKKPQNQKKEPSGKKRGSYSIFSPELRAEIGKYAAEHGSLKASNYFSEILGHDVAVAESTARALKQKYLQKVKHSNVTSLGYSPRGRPLRLGKYDEVVQECLKELFRSGEKVTSFLAITTAKEVLNKFEPELLEENGGSVVLNTSWAKSFLKRIGVRNNS